MIESITVSIACIIGSVLARGSMPLALVSMPLALVSVPLALDPVLMSLALVFVRTSASPVPRRFACWTRAHTASRTRARSTQKGVEEGYLHARTRSRT